MSLDTDQLKMEFLKLSDFKPAEGFANIASRHFTKTKNLLKIMSAQTERLEEIYQALVEKPNQAEFERILNVRGIKKAEMPHLFEAFTK